MDKREEAIKLRKEGLSTRDIAKTLNRSQGTIFYWVKGLPLTSQQKEDIRLRKNSRISEILSGESQKLLWTEERIKKARLNMQRAQRIHTTLFHGYEKEMLPILEKEFGSGLKKECIGGHYCDFANDKVIIETTFCVGKGVSSATERFRNIVSDPRRKILMCKQAGFGKKRRLLVESFGVECLDIDNFYGRE